MQNYHIKIIDEDKQPTENKKFKPITLGFSQEAEHSHQK